MINSNEHLDSTPELTLEVVKQRAVKGIAALTSRTFILQIINRAGDFMITVLLGVAEYGVFWIVSAVINFLAYFSDVGLAAALIQKREKVTEEELRATFTIQQILVLTLLLVLFLSIPVLKSFYHLSDDSLYLIYALGLSFFLSSLKTIPSVLLERKIDFTKLIIPQIAEVIVFNAVAVYFAWKGFGVNSFSIAVIARSVVGVVVMYIVSPWKPGLSLSFKSLKGLFRFGIPYQVNSFLALVKDDGLNLVLGGVLGATGMGLLGWAQRWAYAPLKFFMDQVIKVTFPALSRMQDNKLELSNLLSKSIFFICFLVFPTSIGLILVAPMLTEIIPRYGKWQPALIALSLISINALFAAVTTPLTNMLNAIGKIAITFKLMIMWTALTWVLVPILALNYGVSGAAAGFAIVGASSIVAVYISMKFVNINFMLSIGKPFMAALAMGFCLFLMRGILPVSTISVITLIVVGIITYFVLIFFLIGPTLLIDIKKLLNSLRLR